MDFVFSEDQLSVRALARRILEDQVTDERLRELEAGVAAAMSELGAHIPVQHGLAHREREIEAAGIDRRTWSALATANLLGLAVPERDGGSGLGVVELCLLLEEVGRVVAPVPAWPALVLGALPVARFGTGAQRAAFLPGVLSGDLLLTAALGPGGAAVDGKGSLDGHFDCVPIAQVADAVVVPADGDLYVVDLAGPHAGITVHAQQTTSGLPEAQLELHGVAADRLPEAADDEEPMEWLRQVATVGLCALQLGVTEKALRMTATYTSSREQFGRPIASFQAVGQRAADAYIDVEAIRVTLWNAAWRLDQGLASADAVAVAKFWAADGGQRVLAAAQHLHGGIGVDLDYPLHRYTRWAKHLELALGSGTRQLKVLGERMAAAARSGA